MTLPVRKKPGGERWSWPTYRKMALTGDSGTPTPSHFEAVPQLDRQRWRNVGCCGRVLLRLRLSVGLFPRRVLCHTSQIYLFQRGLLSQDPDVAAAFQHRVPGRDDGRTRGLVSVPNKYAATHEIRWPIYDRAVSRPHGAQQIRNGGLQG
jgi:hypothetical protein